jgi:hypothetical protein
MRTRTKIVRVLVLAAIAVAVLPKPAFADGFGIGAKGGFVYSGLSFSNASDVFNSDSGWMAGLFFGNKAPVGVLAELNYLKKRVTDAATGAKTDLNYLDIPVMVKFNIGSTRANGVSFYIMGGPGFDFKVGDSVSNLAQVPTYENFDFTLIAAGGMEITRFIIEGRGQWGLSNIAVNQLSAGNLHSHSFLLLFGVRFN